MTSTNLPYEYQKIDDNDFDEEDLEDLIIYREINAKRDKRSVLFAKMGLVFLVCFIIFMCALNSSSRKLVNSADKSHKQVSAISNTSSYNLAKSLNATSISTNSTADASSPAPCMTTSYKLAAITGSVYNSKYDYYYSKEMDFLHSSDVSNNYNARP